MNVTETLKAARALIDTPEKWAEKLESEGSVVVLGVTIRNAGILSISTTRRSALAALRNALPSGVKYLHRYVSDPKTVHIDIMKLYDRAIAASEAQL